MKSSSRKRNDLYGLFCLILCTWCAAASAATYYVDAAGGNDNNAGTSTSAPWQTLSKVSNRLFSPGDTILLKRGGTWRGQLLVWSSGTAANPITYGAYGTGNAPIINGADMVAGWTSMGSSKYTANVTAQPEVVAFNGVKGVRAASLGEVNAANKWYWAGNVLTVYSASAPVNIEATTRAYTVGVFTQSYVTVQDLTVRYGFYAAFMHNSAHVVFDNLIVQDSAGAAGVFLLSEAPGETEYNTVRNCRVYHINGSSDALASGNDGCGIYMYGELTTNNTILNNEVHDCGHEGIAVLSGSYNRIAGNTVYRSGQSGIRVALETAAGNVIENNESYQNCLTADDRFGIDLIRVANDNTVRYNVVHDQHETLHDPAIGPDPFNAGTKYGTGGIRFDGGNWEGGDHMESTGNKAYYNVVYSEGWGIESFNFSNIEIYNNTVYNSAYYGISVQSVGSVVETNNVVRNNVVHTAGEALVHHYRMTNTVFDNNVYYPDAANAFLWHVSTGYYPVNFAGWKSASGFDANSRAGDPRFVAAASCKFNLQSGSPCLDAAVDIGLRADHVQTAVPQGGGVDVGAYEMVQQEPIGTPDPTAPVITLLGSTPVTLEVGSVYTDAGATALDDRDGDVTARIVTTSSVHAAVVGGYSVTYAVSDNAGNAAAPVVRTVRIVDTTKPAITLVGSATVTISVGAAYVDAGATATDNYDGTITGRITKSGAVNVATPGAYTVTYNVTDAAGNAATPVVRTVIVQASVDTVKPVITLLGASTVKVKVGRTYADAGATAADNVDGNITARIVTTSNVNTRWPGTYQVAYNVKDSAGHAATQVVRTVKVTFFTKTDEAASELLIQSPIDGSTHYVSATADGAVLALTATAPVNATQVDYAVDGAPAGSSTEPPYLVSIELNPAAGWGEHRVVATAKDASLQDVSSAESTFTLAPVAVQEDADGNGLPDNPFATLAAEGDSWTHAVSVAKTAAQRLVAVAQFIGVDEGDPANAPVVATLVNPNDPGQRVTVSVSRAILEAGEVGMVIVEAAEDLETLVGTDEAVNLAPEPDDMLLATGGQYTEITVLRSRDGGVTFDEVEAARLAEFPVHVELTGIERTDNVTLFTHPMLVDSDPDNGIRVVAEPGAWSADSAANVDAQALVLSADLTSLSLVVPYEVQNKDKEIASALGAGCVGGLLSPSSNHHVGGDALFLACAAVVLVLIGRKAGRFAPSKQGSKADS